MQSNMLDWLKDYLNNTPIDEVKKDWQKVKDMGLRGPNVYEYLAFLSDSPWHYIHFPPEEREMEAPAFMTPTFQGSFFLLKLVP